MDFEPTAHDFAPAPRSLPCMYNCKFKGLKKNPSDRSIHVIPGTARAVYIACAIANVISNSNGIDHMHDMIYINIDIEVHGHVHTCTGIYIHIAIDINPDRDR